MSSVFVNDVEKKYGKGSNKISALHGISFDVKQGELFGIIGPDGAGKTSLFRILVSLLLPDAGQATVDGFDVVKDFKEIRSRVGYMPGRFSLYPDLSVEENLSFFATIFNTSIQENYSLIRDIYQQIEPFRKRKAAALSGGMKQKLALCCALIHRPSVLFLDEPTTGVDAVSRKEFWEMLQRLKHEGITILVSTPYMDEANLCDRVALIQAGKLLTVDTPSGIVRSFQKPLLKVRGGDMLSLLKLLKRTDGVEVAFPFGSWLHVITAENAPGQVMKHLHDHNPTIEVSRTSPTIEDRFIELMNIPRHG